MTVMALNTFETLWLSTVVESHLLNCSWLEVNWQHADWLGGNCARCIWYTITHTITIHVMYMDVYGIYLHMISPTFGSFFGVNAFWGKCRYKNVDAWSLWAVVFSFFESWPLWECAFSYFSYEVFKIDPIHLSIMVKLSPSSSQAEYHVWCLCHSPHPRQTSLAKNK